MAKKKSALQAAASRKLAGIGSKPLSDEQFAHLMLHAEERGEVRRVTLEDGSWVWRLQDRDGSPRIVRPTPGMLAALERFELEGHPAH